MEDAVQLSRRTFPPFAPLERSVCTTGRSSDSESKAYAAYRSPLPSPRPVRNGDFRSPLPLRGSPGIAPGSLFRRFRVACHEALYIVLEVTLQHYMESILFSATTLRHVRLPDLRPTRTIFDLDTIRVIR